MTLFATRFSLLFISVHSLTLYFLLSFLAIAKDISYQENSCQKAETKSSSSAMDSSAHG